MDFSGKIAVVTGASQGTGRAYALALAQAGAKVVATSRSMGVKPGEAPGPFTLAETVRLAREAGTPVEALVCDVGNEDQINRMAQDVVGNHGRIDILVNNAATYPADQDQPHYDPFGFTVEEWRHYFDVNVIGPYLTIKAIAPFMIAQRSGSIVNITSGAAQPSPYGTPAHFGMLAYATTKAALNRLTTWYAAELGQHGIAVNSVCPGAVVTNSWRELTDDLKQQMLDTGRAKPPTAEACGPPVLFLAGQTAESFTGHVLASDDFRVSWP